jgi:hypothetical protein
MIEVYALAAAAFVVAGIALGFIAVVSLAIHREEKARSLTITSPSRLMSGARAACGVYSRMQDVGQQADYHPHDSWR